MGNKMGWSFGKSKKQGAASAGDDEAVQLMQEFNEQQKVLPDTQGTIGFLPGSAEEKLVNLKQLVEQGRRDFFAKNGGVISVETEKPFTAMRPLKFKSAIVGVTA